MSELDMKPSLYDLRNRPRVQSPPRQPTLGSITCGRLFPSRRQLSRKAIPAYRACPPHPPPDRPLAVHTCCRCIDMYSPWVATKL